MFDFGEMEEHYAKTGDDPAARTLPPLLLSPWLGVTKHNPRARIRLFCIGGVGVPAASFAGWCSEAMHQRFPAVEAAVLELPGHGAHEAKPFDDYVACAQAVAVELERIHFSDEEGDRASSSSRRPCRPFAFYGHSLGSRILAEVAALPLGPKGEKCRRFFVSGRGAPHVEVPHGPFREKRPDFEKMAPMGLKQLVLDGALRGSVSQEQLDKYSRWMETMAKSNPKRLQMFAEATYGDLVMGTGPWRPSVSHEKAVSTCPLHYFHGGADGNWPIRLEGRWDDLPGSWARYTTGGFSWSTCEGASHGDMGAVESPAFALICEELTKLVATESLQ